MTMIYANPNMLLNMAKADAYAAGFEFVKVDDYAEFLRQYHTLENYIPHPSGYLSAGVYTDDTQMSVAMSEVLMDDKFLSSFYIGAKPSPQELCAEAFVRVFKRDPRHGYTNAFYQILTECQTGADLLAKVRGDSVKNGACMRAVPLGVLEEPILTLFAELQAQTTHNTEIGRLSSSLIAQLSSMAMYTDHPFAEFSWRMHYPLRYPNEQMPYTYHEFGEMLEKPWEGPVPAEGIATVHAVYTLLATCNTLKEVLDGAIRFGGDTDSVAAIAVGIASARMPDDLPPFLEEQFEVGGEYGVEYLKQLGSNLMYHYREGWLGR